MEFLRNLRESLTGANSIPKLVEKLKDADDEELSEFLLNLCGGGNWHKLDEPNNKSLVAEKMMLKKMYPALKVVKPGLNDVSLGLEDKNLERPEGVQRRKAMIEYWNITHPLNKLPVTGEASASYREVLNILLRGGWYTKEVRDMLNLEKLRTEVENKDNRSGEAYENEDNTPKNEEKKDIINFSTMNNTLLNSTDFSTNYAMQQLYAGQAWVKNNNPSGMTRGVSNELKKARKDAGIGFEKGTGRPSGEGGNYIFFYSIGDGIKATEIALKRGNNIIDKRLQTRVGTDEGPAYARQVMQYAGLDHRTKMRFSDLSKHEMEQLVLAVIRKESPGLYTRLQNNNHLIT